MVGKLAVGSILAVALGKEDAQEVVVWYRYFSVPPIVSSVLLHVVDVQWVGELLQVLLGCCLSSVVVGPWAWHVRVWFGVVVFLGVKLRWIRDFFKRVVLQLVGF